MSTFLDLLNRANYLFQFPFLTALQEYVLYYINNLDLKCLNNIEAWIIIAQRL
jgi:hypothetical protein